MKKLLIALLLILFLSNIMFGAVSISLETIYNIIIGEAEDSIMHFIIIESRLPQAVTALLAGAALSVAGLMLQTQFHNPLAGPSVLGISGGAALGVALITLARLATPFGVLGAAMIGALGVTMLLLVLNNIVRSNLVLLIIGLLIGYLVSSIITILNTIATAQNLQSFVVWGMGDYGGVGMERLPLFAILIIPFLFLSLLLIKPLNALQLGDMYAQNLGVNVPALRNIILIIVGGITAITTAYCGPVAFIGLAVPHIARMIVRSGDFTQLLPTTILIGGAVSLLCNVMSTALFSVVLPLNAVTPLVGIPVILWVLIKKRNG